MTALTLTPTRHDFAPVRAALKRQVDDEILAGVAHAVLQGRDLIDVGFQGWADREARIPMGPEHLFRVFSSTKLVTSCCVLLLMEQGRLGLDDPVERFIPALADRRVLRPGATRIDDTEPARGPITLRHLLTHSAGLSYGLLDPGTVMYKAYTAVRVMNPHATLAQMMDTLAGLPLSFHPGTSFEYSVATDVLGRVVEVVSGQPLDAFMQANVFEPLGMGDTGFVVPADQQHRLAAYYRGVDMQDNTRPGLKRTDSSPYPDAYRTPVAKLSGGGGLVSSLPDQLALLRSLIPAAGCSTLLAPETLRLMMTNHLPDGVWVRFPGTGDVPGKGHGLGGAVTVKPSSIDPPDSVGEFQWGGIAGTHWWIVPKHGIAGVLMAQRVLGFWNPFAFEYRRNVHAAMGLGSR